MRSLIFLCCFSIFSITPIHVLSQNAKIVIDHDKTASIDEVFDMISNQTDYKFIYHEDLFKNLPNVQLKKGIIKANNLLEQSLSIDNNDVVFKFTNKNTIVITSNNKNATVQEHVKGQVTEENGMPLLGVTVLIKNTKRGTTTDFDGKFSIAANIGDIVVFSYLGKETVEFLIESNNPIHIILKSNDESLEEVVIVGYGTTKRKDITGSVSKIDIESLNNQTPVNFDNALVGRAPGVYVMPTNGAPGSSATIRIRGTTSAIGNNEPLYIIDGIPVEIGFGASNSTFEANSSLQTSPLSAINPQDIESIDVLKDASATAIYGSRASNGVIIVTTKNGSGSGKPTITLNATTSVTSFINTERTSLSTSEFGDVVNQAYTNVNRTPPSDAVLFPYGKDIDTDWVDAISQTGRTRDYYLNVSGSSNDRATLYSLSAGLTNQEGTIKSTGFKRYTIRSKTETKLNKVRLGLNFNYNDSKQIGNSQFYSTAASYSPAIPIFDEDGNSGFNSNSNPLTFTTYQKDVDNTNLSLSFFAEIELLKNLFLKSTYSNNIINSLSTSYVPISDAFNQRFSIRGRLNLVDNDYTSKIFDNTLTYSKKSGKHNYNALFGMSHTQNETDNETIGASGFKDDTVSVYPGAADDVEINNAGTISGLSSYFIRANYNFDNTYYLTFTGRADKSTKFGPNNRWGYFPSAALAWRLSNESFLKESSIVNDLKLRASYGKTGAANFDDFQYSTFFTLGNIYNGINGPVSNVIPNPDIKWETTNQLDVALEYTLMDQRISGSVGYYNKRTSDQILLRDIVFETGGKNQFFNIGDFSNSGFEFFVGIDVFRDNKFKWTTELNLSTVNSKVLKLNGAYFENLREGEPIDAFYGWKVEGIFQNQEEIDELNAASPASYYQRFGTSPGDFKFVDANKDGKIDLEDHVRLGQAAPDVYGGWNNTFSFGNFQLTTLFNFSIGNSIANFGKVRELTMYSETSTPGKGILNAWTPDNRDTNIPRLAYRDPNFNERFSDFYIEDASFIKLKNINLVYRFNPKVLKALAITNASLFISGTNLFTITSYSGLDPEINDISANNFEQGRDYERYPNIRTFSLGLNLNF